MRPLEGLRILDFTHVLAGPFCTRLLADMGADVVKINSITRASANNAPSSPYYVIWNRNKRALSLDMQQDKAKDVARQLAHKADVVIDNFSLGVLDRWGIGYEEICKQNEKVIYVQMSGMGSGGPWSNFVTYAPTIHALSGLTHTTGVPDERPIGIGFSYNDHQAGLHAAIAILAGVESRRESGEGQKIDLSQFEVGTSMLGPTLLDYFVNGKVAKPMGNKLPYDQYGPHGCYLCRSYGEDILDEKWLAIVCRDEEEWQALVEVMGKPEWSQQSEFATSTSRHEHAEALDKHLADWVRDKNSRELMVTLQEAGVPAGIVQTGIDMVESDPQLKTNEFLRMCDEEHPRLGETFIDRLPIYFDRTPCDEYVRSKLLGEDNEAVLQDWLGMAQIDVQKGVDEGYIA